MYDEAVKVGEIVKGSERLYRPEVPGSQWARADLDVYYSQALIYTGRPEEGVVRLKQLIAELEGEQKPDDLARQGDPHSYEGWRRNLVLGRGHNNLGYAYWMEYGYYNLALREFRSAVPYFRASDLLEEYANTSDNMGRVYALLYQQSRSESLIDDSVRLRRKLGRDYRLALSLTSRAIAHLAFGEPHRARRLSEEALSIFEHLGGQRGIGLSCITLGRSLRNLGNLWTARLYPQEECDRFFREATTHLLRAAGIFEQVVNEPVRRIQAYNELGCTYRDRAAMHYDSDPKSPMARSISRDAVQSLATSIHLSEEGHLVMYVDSCEDLAQTYFQRKDYNYAEMWLKRAEDRIPDRYRLQKGEGLPPVPEEECIEEFWQQLGKIELLRGYLVYDIGMSLSDDTVPRQVLEQAMHHFVFAAAYFERYSEQATGLRTTFKQLYDRFKQCKHDDLRYIQEQSLPTIAETYALDPTQLGKFFEDTLGLVLHLRS
jgi:tetratricopeptide (TPR) repeat protein